MNNVNPSSKKLFVDTLKIDRSAFEIGDDLNQSNEKSYWLSKTPLERLEAMEYLREIAYNYDPLTARLQRTLEIAEFPTS